MARSWVARLMVEGISIATEITGEEAYYKGCDDGHLRSDAGGNGSTAMTRTRRGRNLQITAADHICALSNRIERCFNKCKHAHCLASNMTRPPRAKYDSHFLNASMYQALSQRGLGVAFIE